MQYVRERRLGEAAKVLAEGANDILAVALDAGYGSHEAFTRAFRAQFGQTPEMVRNRGNLDQIQMPEPILMETKRSMEIAPPKIIDRPATKIAGIAETYSHRAHEPGIPAQWQRFGPHIGHIPGQVGTDAYGVVISPCAGGEMRYVCGVEVSGFAHIPFDWERVDLPARRYAVFHHAGHVSSIRDTWQAIFTQWLPESGTQPAEGPEFERYTAAFDPRTGSGGLEIWIPLQP